jgi:hypothetical protein
MSEQYNTGNMTVEVQNARITRRQLRGYGCSVYLARQVTQGIKPMARVKSANVYPLSVVIAALRSYQQKSRIKQSTKTLIAQVLPELLARLGNVVQVPFAWQGDDELRGLVAGLGNAIQATDAVVAQMKAQVAEIKGKGA